MEAQPSTGGGAGAVSTAGSAEHAASGPSLTTALNWDALEEVFVQCSPRDLLALRSTCRAASELLGKSERVWLAKLRESFGLHLRTIKSLAASQDGLYMRLARRVFEASRAQQLRFQGVYVGGGVDEDAMHYFVDNLFRPDKAPYCSNCSRDADCVALLLDGEVPRDAEFARIRQYMIRRCRYAAALIMNVQMPEHGRDPDDIMHILEDWTDMQLEGFFRDLVGALQAEHALGRLLVFDIPHERLAAEEQKILGVFRWLAERPQAMMAAMLKPPGSDNVMFDTSVVPKLTAGPAGGVRRLAGVITEVSLSRVGNLTCPVAAGAVVAGCIDHSRVEGWSAGEVLALLQGAVADPACALLNGLQDAAEVVAASQAGLLPPIVSTDQTLAGTWHEFDTSEAAAERQAAAAAAAGGGSTAARPAVQRQRTAGDGADDATSGSAAAAATGGSEGAGPSGFGPGSAASAGIITWRPLLWFKFHSVEEAVSFLHRNRPLIELHGSPATVRLRGPPPTRRGHVAAPAEPRGLRARELPTQAEIAHMLAQALQQQHQQQQQQQQAQQQQQQQQQIQQQQGAPDHQAAAAPPVPAEQPLAGVPAPPAAAGAQQPAPGPPQAGAAPAVALYAAGAGGVGLGPAAGPAGGAVLPQGHLQAEDDGEESEGEDSEGADMDADLSDDDESSGSDDDVGGQQGAWLANWVQDEFGADLQEQASAGLCSWRRGFKLFVSWHPDGVVGREPAAGSGGARGALSSCAQGWKPGPWDSQQSAFVPVCPPSLLQEQDMVVAGEGLPFDQMDEGESSEEEGLEDLEAGEHFDLAAAGGGAPAAAGAAPAGPPAGDGAAPAGAAPLLVQASPAETLLRALSRQNTRARNRLRCPLSRPVGANLVLVKLINQEDLMEHYGDQHSWPNIDMTFVGLAGKQVELPPGVVL